MPPDTKVTSAELDRVLKHIERHTDTLSNMIEKNNSTTETIGKQVTLLEAQVTEAREDINKLDVFVRGDNTQTGLRTKTELLESDLKGLKKRVSNIDKNAITDKTENSKKKTAYQVAIVSGSFAGFIALIKIVVGFVL